MYAVPVSVYFSKNKYEARVKLQDSLLLLGPQGTELRFRLRSFYFHFSCHTTGHPS